MSVDIGVDMGWCVGVGVYMCGYGVVCRCRLICVCVRVDRSGCKGGHGGQGGYVCGVVSVWVGLRVYRLVYITWIVGSASGCTRGYVTY